MELPEIENTVACPTLFHLIFAVVDTEEYLYVHLCTEKGVPVKVKRVYVKPGEPYEIHLLQIKRKCVERFREVAEQVTKTRLLMGFTDYTDYCEQLKRRLNKG